MLMQAAGAAARLAPFNQPIAWQAPLGRDHVLTGHIWDVSAGQFIDEAALMDRLVDARFVITGESHNNPDHHQLQLRILKALFGNGRRLALGFEIFSTTDQPILDRLNGSSTDRQEVLMAGLTRSRRHQAMWAQYRPLVRFAFEAGLPIHASDLSRREASAVMREGVKALPASLVERFGLQEPLPALQQAILERDLIEAHCGLLFTGNLEWLVSSQRARDATMAARLQAADIGYGAMLLTGYGHARGDRGVPFLLKDLHRSGDLVNVLFGSVRQALEQPADYREWFGSPQLPFDYVWFTPRVDDEDPCDRLRRIYGRDMTGGGGGD